jgi:prepilin-type N-terminal cleavage/methylation domain-containing protein
VGKVEEMKTKRLTTNSGFSLIELLAVVGIFLVIAAMAVPNMMSAVADFRLRSNVSSTASMMQRLRMEAVRTNQTVGFQSTTAPGGKTKYYADKNNDGSLGAGEYELTLPKEMSPQTSGAPGGLSGTAGFNFLAPGTTLRFNARGLPCTVSTGCVPDVNGNGFVFYFRDSRPLGVNGWGAITVSPAGRVRTWTWSGTAWR